MRIPIEHELDAAVDLLTNFEAHFKKCDSDVKRQHNLIRLIVDRVYGSDRQVVALTLKADYHIRLGDTGKKPTNIELDGNVSVWALRDLNP